jgi:hypothetical protein
MRECNFGFQKVLGISCLAEDLLAFQEGAAPWSLELVFYLMALSVTAVMQR